VFLKTNLPADHSHRESMALRRMRRAKRVLTANQTSYRMSSPSKGRFANVEIDSEAEEGNESFHCGPAGKVLPEAFCAIVRANLSSIRGSIQDCGWHDSRLASSNEAGAAQ